MAEEPANILTAGKYLTDKSQDYLDNYDLLLRPLRAQ